MKLRRPATEDERLFSSVILVLIVYLVLNSLIYTLVEREDSLLLHYLTTLSFLGGIISGVIFFLWTRPAGGTTEGKDPLAVLERVLDPDEIQIIRMVKGAEGMTQDSVRLRTGFSKSKVSILVSSLERSGVLAREKMGRTYKLYLGEWLR